MREEVVVDLPIDFHNEDSTGLIWQWLDAARDPTVVTPQAIIVVGDDDAVAMAQVVDLVDEENGSIVHLRILPGTGDDYQRAMQRALAMSA